MYIVTGGAGFIGSALIWKLNQLGIDDILIVDRLGTGAKWQNLAKRRFLSIMHKDEFLPWLTSHINKLEISGVFHLGASSSTTENNVDYLVSNNLNYSQKLWDLCAHNGIPFIYASSASTYGAGEHGYEDDPSLVSILRPLNPYGFSKQSFDTWVLRQKRTPPFWAGIKFFNVYGPQEYHKGSQASVVWQFVPQIQKHGVLRLFKSYRDNIAHGAQKRDFVYIKDCVDVLVHLMRHTSTARSGIYNLGSGEARSFAELGQAVFRAMGHSEAAFEWIEMPESLRQHYQYFTQASLARLRELGGYPHPMTRIEDGVRDYVTNYLLKEDPYL